MFMSFSERKDKSVRFADTHEDDAAQVDLNVEQQHDIVMYRAYCALKLVMEVLTFCAQSSNWDMMATLQVNSPPDQPDARLSTRTTMEAFQQVMLVFSQLPGCIKRRNITNVNFTKCQTEIALVREESCV